MGKFSFGHLSLMSVLKAFQNSFNLLGVFLSTLDHQYILIRFQKREDFIKSYTKDHWIIEGRRMVINRWSLDFNLGKESSCTPVWVNLPQLRVHLQNPSMLKSIGNTLEKFLYTN
jgi:hypothetical protein